MWSFYVPSMVLVTLADIAMLRRYAGPTVHFSVQLVASVGWITSISIVALVPIDVWSTLYNTDRHQVAVLWLICYWTSQVLSWLVIPLMQGYADAGDFTFWTRLKSSIKGHLAYIMIVACLGVIGVLLLLFWGEAGIKDLLPLAMLLSNTYGLLGVMLLLGYGLVGIPQTLWQKADLETCLKRCLHRLGRAAARLKDARIEMQKVATVVEATSAPMSKRDSLRPLMDRIYKQATEQAPIKPSQASRNSRGQVDLDNLSSDDLDYGCDVEGLASLRKRLKHAIGSYNGKKAEYVNLVVEALRLDQTCRCRSTGNYAIAAPGTPGAQWKNLVVGYRCLAAPWVNRLASLLLGVFSVMLVWSEATIGIGSHDLSPFSHLVYDGQHSEVVTQTTIGLPLWYMCAAAYYSLFKLGMFSFYHMVPRATEPHSLLMNSAQVTRFAAPLAFNFLHVVRMQEGLPNGLKLVFAQKMGRAMADVPLFGTDFNTWFPLTLVIYCLLLVLNVWDTVLHVCIPRRYRFDEDDDSSEHIEAGRTLLGKEQDAQLQGLPVGDACGFSTAPQQEPASSQKVTLLGRAPTSSSSFSPASAHPTSRSRAASHDPEVEAGVASRAPSGFFKWGLSGSSPAAATPPMTTSSSGQLGAGPPTARGLSPPSGVSPLTKSLLRGKVQGSTDSVSSLASNAAPAIGGLDAVFDRMSTRPQRQNSTGRIDDSEEDSIGLLTQPSSTNGGKGTWSKGWR